MLEVASRAASINSRHSSFLLSRNQLRRCIRDDSHKEMTLPTKVPTPKDAAIVIQAG
jgi:hypothetical protein